MPSQSSQTKQWREIGYSASDFLRSLDFNDCLSLYEFAFVVNSWSRKSETRTYDVRKANCFWLADMVYTTLESTNSWPSQETQGAYFKKHTNRFLGIRFLFNSVSYSSKVVEVSWLDSTVAHVRPTFKNHKN